MRIVTAKPPKKHLGGPVQRIEAEPAALPERPRIVTAHATTRFGPVQDIDAEEHERRGHVAQALRDPVRRGHGRRRGKPARYWRSYGNDPLPTGA
jgi:hypothetical protein